MRKFLSVIFSVLMVTVAASAGNNIYEAVPLGGGDINPFPFKKPAPLPWKKNGDSIRTLNPDGTYYDFSQVNVRGSNDGYGRVVRVAEVDSNNGRVLATGAGSVQNQILVAQIVKNGRLVTLQLQAFYTSSDMDDVRMILSETDEYSLASKRYCLVDSAMLQSRRRVADQTRNLCR